MAQCVCTAKQDQRRPELLAEERRVCSVSSVLIFDHVWADPFAAAGFAALANLCQSSSLRLRALMICSSCSLGIELEMATQK